MWTDGNITQIQSTAAPTWQPEWIAVLKKSIESLIILKANLWCRADRVQTQLKIYCHHIFWSVCLAWFERHHAGVSSHEVRNISSVIQSIDTYGLIEMIRVMLKALRTAEVVLTLILSLLCSSESRQCERTTPGLWNQRGSIKLSLFCASELWLRWLFKMSSMEKWRWTTCLSLSLHGHDVLNALDGCDDPCAGLSVQEHHGRMSCIDYRLEPWNHRGWLFLFLISF